MDLITTPEQRILMNCQLYPNSKFAYMYGMVEITDQSANKIEQAIGQAISFFDCLRIQFTKKNGAIFQYIVPYEKKEIPVCDINYAFNEETFELWNNPLYRFFLISKNQKITGYYFIFHHAIVDAYSISLINKYIEQVLTTENFVKQHSYLDFVKHEKKYLKSVNFQLDEEYFKNMLKSSSSYQYLQDFNLSSNRVLIKLSDLETSNLLTFCKSRKTSIFKYLLCVLALYFYKQTGKSIQTIGTTHHNRGSEEMLQTAGMMTSTIPIIIKIDPKEKLESYLKRVNDLLLRTLEKHEFPIDKLLTKLDNDSCFHKTVTEILFNSIPFTSSIYPVKRYTPGEDISKLNFKLNPNSMPKGSPVEIAVDYHLNSYTKKEVNNLLKELIELALTLTFNMDKRIEEVIKTPTSLYQTITEQITDDFLFIVDGANQKTYQEFDSATYQIAKNLNGLDSVIGVSNERTYQYLFSIFGILRSGRTFLPVDFKYQDRANDILTLTNIKKGIVFDKSRYFKNDNLSYLDLIKEKNHHLEKLESDLAYLLFTSGTSGNPKGVMVTNGNVKAFLDSIDELYPNVRKSKIAAFCDFNFDVSILEILLALRTSSTLFLISDKLKKDLRLFYQYVISNNIKHLILPTKFGEEFMRNYPNARIDTLLICGEQMTHYQPTSYQVINGYGPTEFTILACYKIITDAKKYYPIGKTFKNTKWEIDQGELILWGKQRTLGYLNDYAKTKERYITKITDDGILYGYKTGDLAHLKNDDIYITGRVDNQIKFHGYRIELEEIEYFTRSFLGIIDAHCEFINQQFFLSIISSKKIDIKKVEEFLQKRLPYPINFAKIEQVDSFKFNATGKVLNQLQIKNTNLTKTEKELINIFKHNFKMTISPNESFIQYGLDSLQLIFLSMKLEKKFKCTMSIADFYQYPTIASLSEKLKQNEETLVLKPLRVKSLETYLLIFDLSLEINAYQKLIKGLDENASIYAINPKMLLRVKSIEELAIIVSKNLKEIKMTSLKIIGYSSGGIIAIAIANILNKKVNQTVLIDTPNYNKFPLKSKQLFNIVRRNFFGVISLYGIPEAINYAFINLNKLFINKSFFTEQKRLINLISKYQVIKILPNTILNASSKMVKVTNKTLGWEISNICYFDANHTSIMNEKNIVKIIKYMKDYEDYQNDSKTNEQK